MAIEAAAATPGADFRERGLPSSRLPKHVRLLGEGLVETGRAPTPLMIEFEVVTGNASYREGERFYLTASEAQRIYRQPVVGSFD